MKCRSCTTIMTEYGPEAGDGGGITDYNCPNPECACTCHIWERGTGRNYQRTEEWRDKKGNIIYIRKNPLTKGFFLYSNLKVIFSVAFYQ